MRIYNVALILIVALSSKIRFTEQVSSVWYWGVEEYANRTLIIEDLGTVIEPELSQEELKGNVTFNLYTRENTTECEIFVGDNDSLTACNFNASRPTRLVIHGWNNMKNSTMCVDVREAFLLDGNYNVIVVDWGTWAAEEYIYARMKAPYIGEYVSGFIDFLVENGVRAQELIVVGHSIGAHIVGVASRNAKYTPGIFVALDPAGPLFYGPIVYGRMTKTDANCVEVIHTSAGKLGFDADLGTYDHWPNGGSEQTGCGSDTDSTCAHGRSYQYYAEVLETDNFTSYACGSYSNYTSGLCTDNTETLMGRSCENARVKSVATGNYYLETYGTSPYSEG